MIARTAIAAAPGYADIVDLAEASPVVVRATVIMQERVRADPAVPLAAGETAALLTARVEAALVAPGAVGGSLVYLWRGPGDARGRSPAFKGRPVLLFLTPAGAELRLTDAGAQLDWSEAEEARTRAVLTELADPAKRALRVTGVASAFHVAGAVPGEAETQVFLQTADKRPISLAILSRPGEQRRVVVATGEVIDDSAKPVRRDTLLWQRLACFLPARLPARAVAKLAGEDAEAARADYAFAIVSFGPCVRARAPA